MKNEYVEIYARGTGARNHNSSTVKIDNNVLLDHGLFRGLHLIVLDRRNLSKVYNYTYDTMLRDKSYPENIIDEQKTVVCANYTQKDPILGNEAGGILFNTTLVVKRFLTYFTTFLVPEEFAKVVDIPK